jgi:hypothetical protein
MRNDIVAQAQAIRADMNTVTATLTDEQAAAVPNLYELWSPDGVKYYSGADHKHTQAKVRGRISNLLYKCLQTHTSQEDWNPEVTPALWVEVAAEGEYREIKDNMLSTEAFAKGEIGWYKSKDNLFKSLIDSNVWTPETYPAGWEKYEEV